MELNFLYDISISCRNLIQTGRFPIGNKDILSDIMILRDFCSNPIEFHIPLRNSFIPVRNSKYQIGTLFFLWEKDVFL